MNEDDLKIFIFVSLIFVCFSGDNCWEDDEVDLGGFSFVPMMVFEILRFLRLTFLPMMVFEMIMFLDELLTNL